MVCRNSLMATKNAALSAATALNKRNDNLHAPTLGGRIPT